MRDRSNIFSRRQMLTGLGMSAGAFAASGLVVPQAAGAAIEGTATNSVSPQSLVTTPGLKYAGLNLYAFQPVGSATRAVGAWGIYSGDHMAAQLHLPQGAVLREIDVWGQGLAFINLLRAPHDGSTWSSVKLTALGSGAGFQTLREAIADEVVNLADYTYAVDVIAPSSATGIAGVRIGYIPPAVMIPSTPIARVLDTRSGARLAAGTDTVVPLGLPAGARAAILNLTVTQTTGTSGYIGVYPAELSATWPGNSNLNWFGPGQNLATGITTAVGSFGAIILHVGENATHAIVDVQGYLT